MSKEPASKTIVVRVAGSYSNLARALAANNKTPPTPPPSRAIPVSPGTRLRTRPKQ